MKFWGYSFEFLKLQAWYNLQQKLLESCVVYETFKVVNFKTKLIVFDVSEFQEQLFL